MEKHILENIFSYMVKVFHENIFFLKTCIVLKEAISFNIWKHFILF